MPQGGWHTHETATPAKIWENKNENNTELLTPPWLKYLFLEYFIFYIFLLSTLVCQAPNLLTLLVQKSKSSFGNPLFWKINYQLDFSCNSSFFWNVLMPFPAGPQKRQTIGADNSMKIKCILSTQFAELKSLKPLTLKKHLFNFGEKMFKVWQVLSLPFPDSMAMIHYNFIILFFKKKSFRKKKHAFKS